MSDPPPTGGFDDIPFADPPCVVREPAVTLGMDQLTVERMDDGYRARFLDIEGNEATYRGLRGVVARVDGEWTPIAPTGAEAVWFETARVEGPLDAQLGDDRVLRIWRPDR